MRRRLCVAVFVTIFCACSHGGVQTVPRRTVIVHDDFTYTVEGFRVKHDARALRLEVALRVANRAKRVPYVWRDTIAYVADARGRRYAPLSHDVIRIQAGDTAVVMLDFALPRDAHRVVLRFWDGIFMGDVFDGLRYARSAVALY